ncbi:hypothetical protein RD792_012964 [Penstemon davidsonii]|uniref:Isochorismatase-like domain-containing protein n=1 Tax=Penstemon davidsonii TaxID=160366 RepID=A0ABR0CYC6_9LAMI|nr:hypothetical protein RD792_012964 [Penstemon davidsonii]
MASSDELKWKSTALLVIDMQKDFIVSGSPTAVKGGEAIVPNVIKAVHIARSRRIPVIWVVRERRHWYSATAAADKPKPPACKGSVGTELVDGLVIKDDDYKLVKTRFSAFLNTHLHSYLQGTGIHNLVITGVQTPNCIRQTVFDAISMDYRTVTVIVDATAAATPDIHLANIIDMKNVGVETPTLEDWSKADS